MRLSNSTVECGAIHRIEIVKVDANKKKNDFMDFCLSQKLSNMERTKRTHVKWIQTMQTMNLMGNLCCASIMC